MVNLFVDAHVFDHGFEGSASFIQGLYTSLLKLYPGAYRVFLGCSNPDKVMRSFSALDGVEPIKYSSSKRMARLFYEMPSAIRNVRADWAHFQYVTPLVKNCKWILTIHDVLFNDFPEYFPPRYRYSRNALFPFSARRSDILTTVSEYSRERISYWYGISHEKLEVIPNGVSPVSLDDFPQPGPKIRDLVDGGIKFLLCVSRFEPRKNQVTILKVFEKLRLWERGYRLVFVGSRSLPVTNFEDVLSGFSSSARDAIDFIEGISYSDLLRLYSAAAVSIYPSFAEGFGIPPLEAAVCKTPSLCALNTAMIEFDFLNSFHFDAGSPDDLESRLRWVLSDSQEVGVAVSSAYAGVTTRYSWDRAALKFHEVMSRHSASY